MKKILCGVILSVFLMLMIPINSAIEIEIFDNSLPTIEKDNKFIENVVDNSYLNSKKNILKMRFPIIIDHYENGKIVNTFQKEISIIDHFKILLKSLENHKSKSIIDTLLDLEIVSENEISSFWDTTQVNQVCNENKVDSANGEFSFTEEDSSIHIARSGISPIWLIATNLSMAYAEYMIFLIDNSYLMNLLLKQHGFLADLWWIIFFTLLSPAIFSSFLKRFFIRPVGLRNIVWLGSSIASLSIQTDNYNYEGRGNIRANLKLFTGIHLNFVFMQELAGSASIIRAQGVLN